MGTAAPTEIKAEKVKYVFGSKVNKLKLVNAKILDRVSGTSNDLVNLITVTAEEKQREFKKLGGFITN
jgi:hypothetical protein